LTALFIVPLIAFFTGRTVEQRAVAAKMRSVSRNSVLPQVIRTPPLPHEQLPVTEIFALPFAEFYEALRAAPREARAKWASELMAMPEGPRRRAAVSGFYKLLVQFEPEGAVKAIGEIEDVSLQRLALDAAVNAAPGFALPLVAQLSLTLQDRITGKRDHFSEVLLEWALIDPPAAARFIDDHAEAIDEFGRGRYLHIDQVISTWAAVDPKAAKEWIDRKERWGGWEIREFFIEGWYENDRAAAISYVLANVDDEDMGPAIGAIVRNLYFESKDEAMKFVESLPEDKRRDALRDAFHNIGLGDEKETGDTALTPRAVASWIIEFPPSYWHEALGRLFRFTWANAEEMLSWIQQQPPSIREALALEYEAPFANSPSEKVMPVLQIPDPVLRDQLLKGMLVNESVDFDGVKGAIASAPISLGQKRHFLEVVAAATVRRDQEEAARMERERAEVEQDQGSEK
jgi:hypothetical protein